MFSFYFDGSNSILKDLRTETSSWFMFRNKSVWGNMTKSKETLSICFEPLEWWSIVGSAPDKHQILDGRPPDDKKSTCYA